MLLGQRSLLALGLETILLVAVQYCWFQKKIYTRQQVVPMMVQVTLIPPFVVRAAVPRLTLKFPMRYLY